ncbi:PREDICTED: uncharacterized protein LOC105451755 [Wasmannia auropunctata]|uniref:uncharacterized protein LOC105451755 n=1 Tax=Wasmannia auropunctata TaxID=64793 RepID=UPI0005EEEB21|nr:PREDICTED: uncharacterized protein LOC105451755 [Wasmannia auropunctata]
MILLPTLHASLQASPPSTPLHVDEDGAASATLHAFLAFAAMQPNEWRLVATHRLKMRVIRTANTVNNVVVPAAHRIGISMLFRQRKDRWDFNRLQKHTAIVKMLPRMAKEHRVRG